jgi:hypothetical protein
MGSKSKEDIGKDKRVFVLPIVRRLGRPPKKEKKLSYEYLKPWKYEGVSRRTWYRNRAKEK